MIADKDISSLNFSIDVVNGLSTPGLLQHPKKKM
ncbi:MAG: hypothetical protein CM15mP46_0270 [Alphaproteobacteria bacterium]|nr:MAG: hypothetical protein CM15mP46_0270 [Alphaproteobacteria bacterium]